MSGHNFKPAIFFIYFYLQKENDYQVSRLWTKRAFTRHRRIIDAGIGHKKAALSSKNRGEPVPGSTGGRSKKAHHLAAAG
ncbi:hypothetical protein [Collimonas arenae]|uniref:hypothetical protein n=1 Tax=Collimonas arenae TaxID=279058 RepID=UPI000FE1401E|nr:hypothetical protein [Collimonas arenae]